MENENVKPDNLQTIDHKEEVELNEAIDVSLKAFPLEITEKELLARIIDAETKIELQNQFELFNINQSKKNALRIVKLSNLLDKVEDQAIERFERRPDQVSNKELLEYMNVVSNQIERAQKSVDTLKDMPAIQINSQTNEININVAPQLDRDSKGRVMEAIAALLKQAKNPPEIFEGDIIEEIDDAKEVDFIDDYFEKKAIAKTVDDELEVETTNKLKDEGEIISNDNN